MDLKISSEQFGRLKKRRELPEIIRIRVCIPILSAFAPKKPNNVRMPALPRPPFADSYNIALLKYLQADISAA